MQAIAPDPCAGHRRKEVASGRVVGHVADTLGVGLAVGESPVAIDEIDQLKMMREVASAADGKDLGPGEPEERSQHGQDNPGESHQVERNS